MSRGISLKGKAMAKLAINQINVRNRYRKNLGNIESLAASIKELGLLHPIVVRPDGRLIAGERRLAACKRLGWKTVPVTYVDLKEVVRGEFAENAFRKDFLPSEIEAIRRAIEPYERAAAKERQRKQAGTAPGRRKHSGQVSPSDGRSRDRIGAFAGISGRSLAKIQAIVEAAERNPRRFGPLVAQMDRNGRIDGAYRKLQRMKDEEQRLAVKPVGSWAEEEAHLYLWSTNADLPDAFELMERWKFKYITTLTWIKPTFGLGSYFRTTTEHVLFGVRGRLLTRVRNIGTHFTAPKTYHSAKPDLFYQMVEQVSYPPCLDVFARKRRRGWTVWGNGIAAAA
jgi:N6-adenosine-specific RNA methylase IME4